MTSEQKEAISRGRRRAVIRRRQSEAMKASWVRRRQQPNSKPKLNYELVEQILGEDNFRKLIADAVAKKILF